MMQHDDLETLVNLAKCGDEQALQALMLRGKRYVLPVVYGKLRHPEWAREVAHDAVIQACLKLEQLNTPAAFLGWLRVIAENLANNQLRRRALVHADAMLQEVPDAGPTPMEVVEHADTLRRIHQGLARLNRPDRELLRDFYLKDQSVAALAQAHRKPEGTIKRRLHVARQRLKAMMV